MAKKKEEISSLDLALAAIEKSFGQGAIIKYGDNTVIPGIEFIPTSCDKIDEILGGGFVKGRIIELVGKEMSGKTSLCLHLIASAQKMGLVCAFIDAEHALSIPYSQALEVNVNDLYIAQPDNGEQALNIVEALVRSGEVGLIVVDSVAALVPQVEIEGGMDDQQMGLQARLMGKAMRKLASIVNQTDTTLVFTNQYRANLGFGFTKNVTPGGSALKYYSTQRIEMSRIGAIKEGEKVVGNKTKIKCIKNKIAPPFRECEVEIRYGIGIDFMGSLIDNFLEQGFITRKGAWFKMGETSLGQGKQGAIEYFKANPEILEELKGKLK